MTPEQPLSKAPEDCAVSPLDWDQAYVEQLPRVYSYLRSCGHSQADLEARTARTFERAWPARRRYRNDRAAFEICLLAIAHEVAAESMAIGAGESDRSTSQPPAQFVARLRARLAAQELTHQMRTRQVKLYGVLACLLLAAVLVLATPPARESAHGLIEQLQSVQLSRWLAETFASVRTARGASQSALAPAYEADGPVDEFGIDEFRTQEEGLRVANAMGGLANHRVATAPVKSIPNKPMSNRAVRNGSVSQGVTFNRQIGGQVRVGTTRLLLPLLAPTIEATSAARVVKGLGTEAAFVQFCAGQLDAVAVSGPIGPQQRASCEATETEFIELPLAYAAIVILENHANVWADPLSLATLAKVLEAAREDTPIPWNRIDADWPAGALKLYLLRNSLGLTELLDEVIAERSRPLLAGELGSYLDEADLIQAVHRDRNAIAVVPYGYYAAANQSQLLSDTKAARVSDRFGNLVRPSRDSIVTRYYQPLSRVLFLYVNARSAQDLQVRGFVEDLLERGPELASRPIFLPLEREEYQRALENLRAPKLGSVFRSAQADALTVAEILRSNARR